MKILLLSLGLLLSFSVQAQKYGIIKGKIKDADSKEPLLYASVLIKGTTHGTTTDAEGNYVLSNLLPGKYTIVYSFLGYKPEEREITIAGGETKTVNVVLKAEAIMGKEVVVTSQARGQASAINEQLKSNKIVNVVSRERIEEVPSQNAAEAIGRLPGISVQRDGGEGQKVVIRGLSPKYSLITVNGSRISPTDIENRSVDLSMISSDVLSGIEVFKANTPDNDGDALGGTVNFTVKKADKGFHGKADVNTSYNHLVNKWGMYRGVLMLSNRFLNNKLGILALGNLQYANRSSEGISGSYNFGGEREDGSVITNVSNLNLILKDDIRRRYGANLTADYQLNRGTLLFNGLYSFQGRHQIRRRNRYRVENAYHDYDMKDYTQNTNMITTSLSGTHHLQGFDLSWNTSYSFTNNILPKSHTAHFRETAGFTGDLISDEGPEMIPKAAKNDFNRTMWYKDYLDTSAVSDQNFAGQIDLKKPLHFSDQVNGFLKFGAKIRYEDRKRDVGEKQTWNDNIANLAPPEWERDRDNYVLITNFILYQDSTPVLGNDAYPFGPIVDNKVLNDFAYEHESEYTPVKSKDLEDYKARELVSSAYVMAQLDLTSKIMILGGVRMEHTATNYKSIFGTAIRRDDGTEDVSHIVDTTGERTYYNFLPMFHFRYKPLKWFDVRLAVTQGLSRPNYFDLVPWEKYNGDNATWQRGNPELKVTTSWNYDAFFSFYGNFGLFTVGTFYKDIRNTIYDRKRRITNPESDFYGTFLITPVNDEYKSWVKGIEIELQTNLRFLPKPLSNITLYGNYSLMKSLTHFPLLKTRYAYYDHPPYAEIIFIDTIRDGRMPGQVDDIANASIGYESKGFSARLSMTYQGDYTRFVGTRDEFDKVVQGFFRWDFNTYYRFHNGMSVYLNFNNISNTPEAEYLGSPTFPLEYYAYGWSIDLGFKYVF